MANVKMTMAKADEDEFDRVSNFIEIMDSLFCGRSIFSDEESWREWDDDCEEKQILLEIEKDIKDTDGEMWDGEVDNRLVLYEFMKHMWRKANFCGSFQRIVMDAQVLIDNACDPTLDYLEWKPEIKEALSMYEEKHKNDQNTDDASLNIEK